MPSELGQLIRAKREQLEMSLRELARRVEKSPAFIVSLELEETAPAATEETLRTIALELGLDGDLLLTIAGKTPGDVTPQSPLEVALYRRIKRLTPEVQRTLLEQLSNDEHE